MNGIIFEKRSGLSSREVEERRARDGFNELPMKGRRRVWAIFFGILKEPMFLLLLACGVLYLFTGAVQEASMLLGFVFLIIGITFFQERKTERALEALKDLSSPRAQVLRDGEARRIPGREVVMDDLLILSEGDRVPADCVLLDEANFSVDESLLTGESVPVRKSAAKEGTPLNGKPGGDELPFAFSGTLVVSGQAVGKVAAIGARTELGKIGKALSAVKEEPTPLQKQIARLVRTFAIAGAFLCVLVVVVYTLTRGKLLEGFLAGLSLAMAILPEEFPVVLTIFLALGSWRLSKFRILTRRISAVETLGSATVLCVDKTGTLTQNQMTVSDLVTAEGALSIPAEPKELPSAFHGVLAHSILASPVDPFDPMEKAMKTLGARGLPKAGTPHPSWKLEKRYPLGRELLAMSRVWSTGVDGERFVATKGAPEAIGQLCHFDAPRTVWLRGNLERLGNEGKRVIGVARAAHPRGELPERQGDFSFDFVGLIGLADPVRPDVKGAIEECRGAGIRTLMITGDYPGTAMSIAREIGLPNADRAIPGPEMEGWSEDELKERIRGASIFARMVPEQKLRIVTALKEQGEIVAMTGDGVNDAPALKAAHIGVAMGGRGTDVARESAALVLLDDDFRSIVTAVRMGRRIYDNLKKAMMFTLAVHIPIAGLSLLPVLFHWPLILFPAHIVFLELIIDPACSLVFEADQDDRGVMNRPPRPLGARLFDRSTVLNCLLQGGLTLAVTLGVFLFIRDRHSAEEARALAFLTLVVCNLGMILSNRSLKRSGFSMLREKNNAFKWVLGGTVLCLVLVLTVPFLRQLFRFGPVAWADLILPLAGGLVAVVLMELRKLIPFLVKRPTAIKEDARSVE